MTEDTTPPVPRRAERTATTASRAPVQNENPRAILINWILMALGLASIFWLANLCSDYL